MEMINLSTSKKGNAMEADFVSPGDERWADLLRSAPHDIYHRPEYLVFSGKYEGGDPFAFYCQNQGEKFLIPLLTRKLPATLEAPSDWCDLITPYGYPSPILFPGEKSAELEGFLKAFYEICKGRNVVSAFVRLHPLLPLPLDVLEKYGVLVKHGETVAIDLTLSEEEMWSQTRRNHRQNIKKLNRAGYEVKMDDWTYFEDFIRIYRSTMTRADAEDFYFFSDEYFFDFKTFLKERLHLCVVLSPDSEVAAGGLFTEGGEGIVECPFAGTCEKYLKEAPAKLMFDFARRWAKKSGFKMLHLGGGVGGNSDSLFKFKTGFSNLCYEFHTFRLVIDPPKYSKLNQNWERFSGEGRPSDCAFFPAYRKTY